MDYFLSGIVIDERIKATMPAIKRSKHIKTFSCINKGCKNRFLREEMIEVEWRKDSPLACPECFPEMDNKKYK